MPGEYLQGQLEEGYYIARWCCIDDSHPRRTWSHLNKGWFVVQLFIQHLKLPFVCLIGDNQMFSPDEFIFKSKIDIPPEDD